jgi:hypothetical protein
VSGDPRDLIGSAFGGIVGSTGDDPINRLLTDAQRKTLLATIERIMTASFLPFPLPGWVAALVKDAIRNEERAVNLMAVLPPGVGKATVEKVKRIAKELGALSREVNEQGALDLLFDLEWDAALYGEDDRRIQRRRQWLALWMLKYNIKEGDDVVSKEAADIEKKAVDRGEMLADAAVDGATVIGGMTIRERYALEIMPSTFAVRVSSIAIREANEDRRVVGHPIARVTTLTDADRDAMADEAFKMADAMLRASVK